jgi:aldehyde dehydrogenase (NAD+)
MGPLINAAAVERDDAGARTRSAPRAAKSSTAAGVSTAGGFFVEPTLVAPAADMPIVEEETFAPILYVMEFDTLDRGHRAGTTPFPRA